MFFRYSIQFFLSFSFFLLFNVFCFSLNIYTIYEDPYGFEDQKYLRDIFFLEKKYANNVYDKTYLIKKGLLYYKLRNYNKSLFVMKKAEKIYPKNSNIKVLLVQIYLKINDYDIAESYLVKMIQSNPQFYFAYILYGNLFFQKEFYHRAIEKYRYALDINNKLIFSYIHLAKCYFKLGNIEKSLKVYNKIKNIDYRDSQVNFAIGLYFYEIKEYEKSLYYLNNVMVLNQNYIYSKVLLYRVLFYLGKFPQSRDVLMELISKNPHEKLYYDLALIYKELNEPQKSLETIFFAIQKNPFNEVYQIFAEKIYFQFYKKNSEIDSFKEKIFEVFYKRALFFYEKRNINLALVFF